MWWPGWPAHSSPKTDPLQLRVTGYRLCTHRLKNSLTYLFICLPYTCTVHYTILLYFSGADKGELSRRILLQHFSLRQAVLIILKTFSLLSGGEGNFTNLLIYQALRAVSARVVDPNTGTLNLDPDPEFWLSLDPDPVLCYQF